MRLIVSLGFAFGILLAVQDVRAASPLEVAEAERMFAEGVALVAKGQHAEACPKFERSQELDPALGTQFNLADCREKTGRLAAALVLFEKVASAAHEAGKKERERDAHARADALRPRVPKMRFVIETEAMGLPGFTITVDDNQQVSPNDRPLVEVGDHVVRATATNHEAFVGRVTAIESSTVDVNIPMLTKVAVVGVTPAAAALAPVTGKDREVGSRQRLVGLSLAAVGLTGLAIGTAFGISALTNRGDAIDACGSTDPKACRPGPGNPAALWDDATAAGNFSTAFFIIGGVVLAAGAVVYLVAPSAAKPTSPPQRSSLRGVLSQLAHGTF